jgi:hypothetical protein
MLHKAVPVLEQQLDFMFQASFVLLLLLLSVDWP